MTPAIPISEALADSNLLGSALGDIASWQVWRVVLKAVTCESSLPLRLDVAKFTPE